MGAHPTLRGQAGGHGLTARLRHFHDAREGGALRASEHRRGRTVSELAGSWREGYLSADTFETRVGAAYAARTPGQLARLTADLPPRSIAESASRLWRWLWGPDEEQRPRVLSPPPRGRTGETVLTLGRHPGCNLVLDDPTVSRRHARLRLDGDRWVVCDLHSVNGTRVNGWRIEEAIIRDGDRLTMGHLDLVFRD